MKGKIKLIFRSRGYGFLIPEGGTEGKDVFFNVHNFEQAGIFDQLKTGDELEFELGKNERGFIAQKIRKPEITN